MKDAEPARSRFILPTDPRAGRFLYPLPPTWWSRPYEYAWAARFADRQAEVLDAGCGIPHPFKFWLTSSCRQVAALDLDPRLAEPAALTAAVREAAGADADACLPAGWEQRLECTVGSLTRLPYPDERFDRVFCLSTLEHLPEARQLAALREMARVLRPTGLLVLTVDIPPLYTGDIHFLVQEAGLAFGAGVEFLRPASAVFASPWGPLSCFRALLIRRQGKARCP